MAASIAVKKLSVLDGPSKDTLLSADPGLKLELSPEHTFQRKKYPGLCIPDVEPVVEKVGA